MKNACVVGYGAIGPNHANANQQTDSVRLYAVCDNDPARAKRCVDQYGVKDYRDFDEMLQDPNIDAVHICTPHYLHFPMIKKALAAGKQVVTEKPITMTRVEYEELLTLQGVEKVCCVLQNRLNPCVREMKRIAESGELGKVVTARGLLTWNKDMGYYGNDAWRGKWATEGGGVLINQAIHTMDLFHYITGKVQSVKAQMANFDLPEIEVEDTLSAFLRLQNGGRGVFFASNAYGVNSATMFEVVFEKGTLRYEARRLFKDGVLVQEDEHPDMGKGYWGKGHAGLIKDFYDRGVYFSPLDVKPTMDCVFAMYDSARVGGKELKL